MENKTIDFFDDVGLGNTLEKIAEHLPRDIRREQLPTIEDRDALDDGQFALCVITKQASKLNKFPIDTRLNTCLSNEYFELNHHKLPLDAQKTAAAFIKKACVKYGIEPATSVKIASTDQSPTTNLYVENMKSVPGGRLVKTASNCSHFALEDRYPLESAEHIKQAESYFDTYKAHFTPQERHTFAKNVLARAGELGVKTASANLDIYAATRYGNNVSQHLSYRESLLSHSSPLKGKFNKLASYQGKVDPSTFANTLFELDKRAGLDKYHDSQIKNPYETTSAMVKSASYVYTKDGIHMTDMDLQNALNTKSDLIESYFGKTLVDGLKKEGPASFEALPDDAKDIIARIWNGEIQ